MNRVRGVRDTKPFRYFDKGDLAVIGRASAVADVFGFHLWGFPAWLIWLFIHLMYIVEFRSRVIVFVQWAFLYLTSNRGARLITGETASDALAGTAPMKTPIERMSVRLLFGTETLSPDANDGFECSRNVFEHEIGILVPVYSLQPASTVVLKHRGGHRSRKQAAAAESPNDGRLCGESTLSRRHRKLPFLAAADATDCRYARTPDTVDATTYA